METPKTPEEMQEATESVARGEGNPGTSDDVMQETRETTEEADATENNSQD